MPKIRGTRCKNWFQLARLSIITETNPWYLWTVCLVDLTRLRISALRSTRSRAAVTGPMYMHGSPVHAYY